MSDDAPAVNETEAYLSEVLFGEDGSAGDLADHIDELFCSHYNVAQIIAALAHTLVVKHVDAHTTLSGTICQPHLNVGTTELLQTIRKWVDDCVAARLTPEPKEKDGEAPRE